MKTLTNTYGSLLKVDFVGKFFAYLIESTIRPVTKPIEDTTIEEGRRGGCSVLQTFTRWVHGEHHMKIFDHLKWRG